MVCVHISLINNAMINVKKKYSAPAMRAFPLKPQKSLLQISDGDKTPWLPPGPIGIAPLDESHNG